MLPALACLLVFAGPFDDFKPGERALLAAPDKIVVRRLARNSPDEAQLTVLESRTLTSKKDLVTGLAALKVGLGHQAMPTPCFNPHHRIILYRGKQKLSLLICFLCHRYKVEDPVETRPYLPFSNDAEPLIKKILKG